MKTTNGVVHKIVDWGKRLAIVAHFHGGPKYIAWMGIVPLAGHDGIGQAGNALDRGGIYMMLVEEIGQNYVGCLWNRYDTLGGNSLYRRLHNAYHLDIIVYFRGEFCNLDVSIAVIDSNGDCPIAMFIYILFG